MRSDWVWLIGWLMDGWIGLIAGMFSFFLSFDWLIDWGPLKRNKKNSKRIAKHLTYPRLSHSPNSPWKNSTCNDGRCKCAKIHSVKIFSVLVKPCYERLPNLLWLLHVPLKKNKNAGLAWGCAGVGKKIHPKYIESWLKSFPFHLWFHNPCKPGWYTLGGPLLPQKNGFHFFSNHSILPWLWDRTTPELIPITELYMENLLLNVTERQWKVLSQSKSHLKAVCLFFFGMMKLLMEIPVGTGCFKKYGGFFTRWCRGSSMNSISIEGGFPNSLGKGQCQSQCLTSELLVKRQQKIVETTTNRQQKRHIQQQKTEITNAS